MMRPITAPRPLTLVWLFVAFVAVAAAVGLSPDRLLARLDAAAEQFRPDLIQGIWLVRMGLAATALLALATAWGVTVGERRGSSPPTATRRVLAARTAGINPAARHDFYPRMNHDMLLAGLILLLAVALTLPSLCNSFWWDELTSLILVVRRGPAVILAYSCKANNHVLNSLGMWLTSRMLGESEAWVRLPAWLLGLATSQAVFWTLVSQWGRGRAFLAAALTAAHLSVAGHAVEARGYTGAILFSYLSCWLFAECLRRARPRVAVAYVVVTLAAVGFITTTILVPVAHGLVALALLLRGPAEQKAAASNAVLACLWAGVLAIVFFGLPLPQTLHYARSTEAAHDHLPLGLPLLEGAARYLAGNSTWPAALLFLALSLWGWRRGRVDRALALACLGPGVLTLVYLAAPGTLLSPRFLCFLIVPAVLGLTLAAAELAARGPVTRGLLAAGAILWLGFAAQGHVRSLLVGNPDLKDLARRSVGGQVALVGPQADMNVYYFPRALAVSPEAEALEKCAVVVEGRLARDQPDPRLLARGFQLSERLDSAAAGRTFYLIYRREDVEARGE